jgi:hypothetical protein
LFCSGKHRHSSKKIHFADSPPDDENLAWVMERDSIVQDLAFGIGGYTGIHLTRFLACTLATQLLSFATTSFNRLASKKTPLKPCFETVDGILELLQGEFEP